MKPIDFPFANKLLGKYQDEYVTLPVWVSDDGNEVVACWKLTLWERLKLLWTGELWLRQLTFGGNLQPQLPCVNQPGVLS